MFVVPPKSSLPHSLKTAGARYVTAHLTFRNDQACIIITRMLVIDHVPLQPFPPKTCSLSFIPGSRSQSGSDHRHSPNQAPPVNGDPCAHDPKCSLRHMLNSCLVVIVCFRAQSTYACGYDRDSLPIRHTKGKVVINNGNSFRCQVPLLCISLPFLMRIMKSLLSCKSRPA